MNTLFFILKRIFRTVWALWCIIPFMAVSILVVPFVVFHIWIFGGRKTALLHCLYWGAPAMLWSMLIFPKIKNRRFIEKDKGYVIVANHNAHIDIVINPYAFRKYPNVFTFLSKKEVTQIPIFGEIVKRVAVLVDSKSTISRKNSYVYMKKVLEEGISVMIYPEGTRNKTEEPLQPFFDGAFRLAIEMQTPLLVQTIVGIKNISDHRYLFDMCPGRVTCIWDEPIDTTGMTLHDVPALKERVRNIMIGHLVKKN